MSDNPPARKFMFDRSFDDIEAAQRAAIERKPVTLKPEQVDALKKEAYDLGFTAGQKAGLDDQSHKLSVLLSQIEKQLVEMIKNGEAAHQERSHQTREVILAIAKKILPDFTKRYGLQEIQSLVASVMTDMVHEARLVVRVHADEFDAVNAKVNEMTIQQAYSGKIVILADPNIALGDCRIEWADGGVERNTQATWSDIEQLITPENHETTQTDKE